jgi:hypothetical protein
MPTTRMVPGPAARDWSVRPPRPAGAPPALTLPLPLPLSRTHKEGPGLPARGPVSLTLPAAGTSVACNHPVVERRLAPGDLKLPGQIAGGSTSTRLRHCRSAAITTRDHRPGRGVTQSPGAGPGAYGLSTRRGTPMPAGCQSGPLRDSWTRTWIGTTLPRGRRSSALLASPRHARLGQDPPLSLLFKGPWLPHMTKV